LVEIAPASANLSVRKLELERQQVRRWARGGSRASTRQGRRLDCKPVDAPLIRGRSDAFDARQPGSVLSASGYPAKEIWLQLPRRLAKNRSDGVRFRTCEDTLVAKP